MFVPAAVTAVGAAILIPLSPVMIFGWGPLPGFGIAGGAAAVLVFYVVGSAIFAFYLWSRRGVLAPSLRPQASRWPLMRDILRIGLLSSIFQLLDQSHNRSRDRACRLLRPGGGCRLRHRSAA